MTYNVFGWTLNLAQSISQPVWYLNGVTLYFLSLPFSLGATRVVRPLVTPLTKCTISTCINIKNCMGRGTTPSPSPLGRERETLSPSLPGLHNFAVFGQSTGRVVEVPAHFYKVDAPAGMGSLFLLLFVI